MYITLTHTYTHAHTEAHYTSACPSPAPCTPPAQSIRFPHFISFSIFSPRCKNRLIIVKTYKDTGGHPSSYILLYYT